MLSKSAQNPEDSFDLFQFLKNLDHFSTGPKSGPLMSTSFPEDVKRHVTGYVLVAKDKYEFLNNESQDATQEEHSKWFHAHW